MKKHLHILLILISSLTLSGCDLLPFDKSSKDDAIIMVSPTELLFESSSSSKTVKVTYDGDWIVEGESNWCTITPNYGEGDTDVTITVTENDTDAQREHEVLFVDADGNRMSLLITQYEFINTNYKEISWDDDSVVYDENNGQITMQNGDNVDVGQAVILPAELNGAIRVVESITKDGNNTILVTRQGEMQDVFRDIDFTLVTSESIATKVTRSSGKHIITPTSIYAVSDDGIEVIYDADNPNTRSFNMDAEFGVNIESDFSDYTVFKNDYLNVFFEKAYCNTGVDFVFEFAFEAEPESILEFKGKLESLRAYIEGNLNMDYLAKCIASSKYSYEDGYDEVRCFKENVINDFLFEFMVGTVPVYVTISTDLCGLMDVEAEAEATISSGFSLSSTSQLGLEYNASTDKITPISNFESKFDSYPLTLTAYGTANAKMSLYPKFNVMFYDLLGPSIEPISYVELDLKAGLRASTDGDNYYGWQGELNSGMKYRLGMTFDFVGLYTKSIYTDVQEAESFYTKILKDPVALKLSEDNKSDIYVGEDVDVTFTTQGYNNLTFGYYSCPDVYVILESDGVVSDNIVVSDEDGLATVVWRPINTTQTLNAKIVDKDGETISQVTYAPEITLQSVVYPYDYTNPNDNITYSVSLSGGLEWIYAGKGTYSEAKALCPPDSWRFATCDEIYGHVYNYYFKPSGVLSIASTYYTYWWSSNAGEVVYNKYKYSMINSWGTTTIEADQTGYIYFCREI